jgi:hypothetical protein
MARKRQRTEAPPWPVFDAPLLQAIASAFRRRSKSLRYQAGLSCERVFSETTDGVFERLNLDLRPGAGALRLSVWQDGVMWLRLCVPAPGRNSGWALLERFYGSVLDVAPETLVNLLEGTIAEPFHPGETDPVAYRERLRTTWGRVRPYEQG